MIIDNKIFERADRIAAISPFKISFSFWGNKAERIYLILSTVSPVNLTAPMVKCELCSYSAINVLSLASSSACGSTRSPYFLNCWYTSWAVPALSPRGSVLLFSRKRCPRGCGVSLRSAPSARRCR